MSTHRYEHEITITGPKETIAALEFSPDGRALASGCEDGSITIFSTISWEPSLTFVNVSPSTSLVWHPRIEGLLFCGFKSGDVLPLRTNCPGANSSPRIWAHTSHGSTNCLSHDPTLNVLAVGSGKDVVMVKYRTGGEHTYVAWGTNRCLPPPPGLPQLRGAKFPDEATAQSIHFLQGRDLFIVSYLHHGVICWDRNSLSVVWQITPRSCQIGRSCLSVDNGAIAVTNLFDGVDWYNLTTQDLAESLHTTIGENVITPIIRDDEGFLVIGGSVGAVQVLQPPPAALAQTLELEHGKIVQALAYISQFNGRGLLAAGTSELGSRTIIMVWRSGRDRGNIVAYEHKVRGLCLIIDENPYLKVTIEDRVGAVAADLVEDNFHIDRCVLFNWVLGNSILLVV